MTDLCKCQDYAGNVCNKEMSEEEMEQDGMCSVCADFVWNELYGDGKAWFHNEGGCV